MKRAVFSYFLGGDEIEFLGADGEIYVLKPGQITVIPFLNALAFEKAGVGKIVEEITDNKTEPAITGREDYIKNWAREALQLELNKPPEQRNVDRIIELKMILNGINPFNPQEFRRIDNKQQIKTTPSTPTTTRPHSQPTRPTGLCSPYNTGQVDNFENEYKDDNKVGLAEILEVYGLRCATTIQAFRIRGLDEIDLDGYSVLDYGYTRIEVHEEFRKLLREFGYSDEDYRVVMLFDKYECPKHGDVYKPVVDWELRFLEEDGERRRQLRVHAGRIHPLKKYNDSRRYSAQKLEQFRVIAEKMRARGIISYRQFDGELKQVRHYESDLALMWLVFTVPERMSKGLMNYALAKPENRKRIEELMRKATRKAIEIFLRKYLKKHENVSLSGKFTVGGLMNVHLWSSSSPIHPHVHNHVCLWNVVVWNGQIIRFSPYIPSEWMQELRKIWRDEFFKLLKHSKFSEIQVWTDPFVSQDYELFNVYNSYTWLRVKDGDFENAGKIVHHLRYNSRKAIVDLNEFFYNGIKADELDGLEKKWIRYLVEYSNRTSNFGFMNNWRQVFGIPREVAAEIKRKAWDKEEYCPICGRKMEFIETVTVNEVAKSKRLLVLWYFDRRMNIEVWREGYRCYELSTPAGL